MNLLMFVVYSAPEPKAQSVVRIDELQLSTNILIAAKLEKGEKRLRSLKDLVQSLLNNGDALCNKVKALKDANVPSSELVAALQAAKEAYQQVVYIVEQAKKEIHREVVCIVEAYKKTGKKLTKEEKKPITSAMRNIASAMRNIESALQGKARAARNTSDMLAYVNAPQQDQITAYQKVSEAYKEASISTEDEREKKWLIGLSVMYLVNKLTLENAPGIQQIKAYQDAVVAYQGISVAYQDIEDKEHWKSEHALHSVARCSYNIAMLLQNEHNLLKNQDSAFSEKALQASSDRLIQQAEEWKKAVNAYEVALTKTEDKQKHTPLLLRLAKSLKFRAIALKSLVYVTRDGATKAHYLSDVYYLFSQRVQVLKKADVSLRDQEAAENDSTAAKLAQDDHNKTSLLTEAALASLNEKYVPKDTTASLGASTAWSGRSNNNKR